MRYSLIVVRMVLKGTTMPHKVLFIDPEAHIRRLVEVNLIWAGYEVECLDDYRKGLAKAKEWKPQVVVMEIIFPSNGDGGFDLLKDLSEDPETQQIGTIFLTYRIKDCDVFRGRQTGVSCYLLKPFNPMELLTFVKRVIEGPGL